MPRPPNRKPIKTHKLKAHRRGRRAERVAIFWLREKGYRIVARNLRLPQGEIDVVARRGRVLVFIEVKYRADIGLAQDAVTAHFVGAQPALQGLRWRFDVMALAPYHWPRHRINVWRAA